MSEQINQEFYIQDALTVCEKLLGCVLVHQTEDGITSGIIVETEAYSQDDAASHSFKGQTPRTKVMFGPGGHAYVYFTYGMHYCFNVVTGPDRHGQAVLIRALEPVEGLDIMQKRRKKDSQLDLCNGPAKLVQAMGITKEDYGKPLYKNTELFIKPNRTYSQGQIIRGPRIGISHAKEKPWRFYVKDSIYVSKPHL